MLNLIFLQNEGSGKPYSCVRPQSIQRVYFLSGECAYSIKREVDRQIFFIIV